MIRTFQRSASSLFTILIGSRWAPLWVNGTLFSHINHNNNISFSSSFNSVNPFTHSHCGGGVAALTSCKRFCSTLNNNTNASLETAFGSPLVGKGFHLANFIQYVEEQNTKNNNINNNAEYYNTLLNQLEPNNHNNHNGKHLVLLKGRLERLRVRGNVAFAVLRQPPTGDTIQIVFSHDKSQAQDQQNNNNNDNNDNNSNAPAFNIVKAIKKVNVESIIEVYGELKPAESTVLSCTCQHYELHVHEGLLKEKDNNDKDKDVVLLNVISPAQAPLPFPLQDPTTKLNTKLNARAYDLRTTLSNAIFQLNSQVNFYFRQLLDNLEFVEIHTPKLIPAASEGSGSSVFRVENYFSNTPTISENNNNNNNENNSNNNNSQAVYLAQSPQLYKQMAVMGDLLRTYEVGPVFRAEKSFTHRHLCEFTGLDAEFVIDDAYVSKFIQSVSTNNNNNNSNNNNNKNVSMKSGEINTSYFQVLNVLEYVVCGVIKGLQTKPKNQKLVEKVFACMKTLQENQNINENSSNNNNKNDYMNGNATIVYEVPEEIIQLYNLPFDTPPLADNNNNNNKSQKVSTDPYHARLGGGGGSAFQLQNNNNNNNTQIENPKVLRMTFDDAVQLLKDSNAFEEEALFNQQNNITNSNNNYTDKDKKEFFIDDFSLFLEKKLGVLIKHRYKVDVYIIDQFYFTARPFYTLPLSLVHHEAAFLNETNINANNKDDNINNNNNNKKDKKKKKKDKKQKQEQATEIDNESTNNAKNDIYDFNAAIQALTTNPYQKDNHNGDTHNYAHLKTCSFDMYLRGEEICSGAQRIHHKPLLAFSCGPHKKNLPPAALQEDLQDYANAFCYGSWPHGGFGLGLERIVLFFLELDDIRRCSLFPRDPRRVRP